MRRIDISSYPVSLRNDQGIPRFKEQQCECGLDLTLADPINVNVKGLNDTSGNCPQCNAVHPLDVPEYLKAPYPFRDSLIEMLLSRDNQLTGRELLERDDIARKVRDCEDGHILLEEEEWNKVTRAIETVKGLGRADVELVRRVLEAQQIEVEAKRDESEVQG